MKAVKFGKIRKVCKDLDANLKPLDPATVLVCAAEISSLLRKFQSKQAKVFDLIEGGLKESEEVNEIVIHDKEAHEGSKMDEEIYQDYLENFKMKCMTIRGRIIRYSKNVVTLADANEYKGD